MESHTTSKNTFKDKAMRAVAVLGVVAILLLGAWGIIQVAFMLYGFIGSLGGESPSASNNQNQTAQVVSVTAPQTITSGTPFTLSFNYPSTDAKYAYEISYACAAGLSVSAPLPSGASQSVPCNTPFNYTSANATMQLTATLTGKTPVATAFIVAAKNLSNGSIAATGSANSTVAPSSKTGTSPAPAKPVKPSTTPASTYVPSTNTASLYGLPDLAVYAGSVTNSGGRVNVQFTVQNVGTNTVPAGWTFNAALPTSPSYTYPSGSQQALRPGDKIVYSLGFNMQNSSYTYYQSNYTYPYYRSINPNCGYTTTYTYNGSYNEPRQAYQCNGTVINYTNNYNDYYYNPYGYNNYYSDYSSGTVVVTADPNNYQSESSESNNTATISVGYY